MLFCITKIEFIEIYVEIWDIRYFKSNNFEFNFKSNFYQVFLSNFNFFQVSINSEHSSFWDQIWPSNW